jgi:alanine dehydrogenase
MNKAHAARTRVHGRTGGMNRDEILFLTPRDVQELLTLDECIAAVTCAFRLHGEGKAAPPGVLGVHASDGGFHIKAGLLDLGAIYFAAKVNGNFPENGHRLGLPTIQGVIVLCDGANGTPLAVMDSREITTLRTGAATAVAAKYLARRDSRTVTICGCGNQGRVQLAALSRVCSLDSAFAYDKDGELALRFAREMETRLKISVIATADLAAAVRQSDICVTCTPARHPLAGLDHVNPGTFVAAVGADNPEKQELPPTLMARSKIVCDTLEQCAAMGDLHHALEAGAVHRADVHAELAEIVAGKKPGRESADEITIFDSTGMALQDVAAAAAVYEKAQRQGAGARLSLAPGSSVLQ